MEKTKTEKYNITPREKDIMYLLAFGMSNNEIAEILFISASTVKANLSKIYEKLGVKNRTEATRKIIDEKLTPPQDSEQP